MPSLPVGAAELPRLEAELRIERVQERGLPDPAVSGKNGPRVREPRPQGVDPLAGSSRDRQDRYGGLERTNLLGKLPLEQIDLVHDEERIEPARVRGEEQPIDDARPKGRLGDGPHDRESIHVRRDHLLLPSIVARPATCQPGPTRRTSSRETSGQTRASTISKRRITLHSMPR